MTHFVVIETFLSLAYSFEPFESNELTLYYTLKHMFDKVSLLNPSNLIEDSESGFSVDFS